MSALLVAVLAASAAAGTPALKDPGPERMVRGATYVDRAGALRAAFRGAHGPEVRNVHLGFRLAGGVGPSAHTDPSGS